MPNLQLPDPNDLAVAILAGDRQRALELSVAVPCAARLNALGFTRHARTILERLAGPDLSPLRWRGPHTLRAALEAADDPVVPKRLRRLCNLAHDRLTHDLAGRWEHGRCRDCAPRAAALRLHRWRIALEDA